MATVIITNSYTSEKTTIDSEQFARIPVIGDRVYFNRSSSSVVTSVIHDPFEGKIYIHVGNGCY